MSKFYFEISLFMGMIGFVVALNSFGMFNFLKPQIKVFQTEGSSIFDFEDFFQRDKNACKILDNTFNSIKSYLKTYRVKSFYIEQNGKFYKGCSKIYQNIDNRSVTFVKSRTFWDNEDYAITIYPEDSKVTYVHINDKTFTFKLK